MLVVDDVSALLEADNENKQLTKSIVSLTKNSNTAGSITLWAIMKNVTMFDKLYDRQLAFENDKISEFKN